MDSNTTRDLATETLQGSPYGGPKVRIGEWRIAIHPHAGTVSAEVGPEFVNSTGENGTEPINLFGVDYAVKALFVLSKDGTVTLDRINGFRADGSDWNLTKAARDKAIPLATGVLAAAIIDQEKAIGEAMASHRAKLKVASIESEIAELENQLTGARLELAKVRGEL